MKNYYLISDAAKLVEVETHVLRYWEEELKLPIKRNELGHRFYTKKDVERFCRIKELKEKGLQLKAIKSLMDHDTEDKLTLSIVPVSAGEHLVEQQEDSAKVATGNETKEEKARRLQWLLQQMIAETLRENNAELCADIKESILKEMDYQFRIQEEKEDAREKKRSAKEDEHFQRLDELLRERSKKPIKDKSTKRKRHSFF